MTDAHLRDELIRHLFSAISIVAKGAEIPLPTQIAVVGNFVDAMLQARGGEPILNAPDNIKPASKKSDNMDLGRGGENQLKLGEALILLDQTISIPTNETADNLGVTTIPTASPSAGLPLDENELNYIMKIYHSVDELKVQMHYSDILKLVEQSRAAIQLRSELDTINKCTELHVAHITRLKAENDKLHDAGIDLTFERNKLQAALAAAREVLKFYSHPLTYAFNDYDGEVSDIQKDQGTKARQAMGEE